MPYSEKLCDLINNLTLQIFVLELDGHQFEYYILKEAKGTELLRKVLEKHHITELTNFGLRYINSKGIKKWINLRNPIALEVDNITVPIKLELSVKFYVPANILQDYPIKKAFLTQIKNDIENGRLIISDETYEILRFLALLAQAEYGAYFKQICYATPPDFNFERELIQEHKRIETMSKLAALDEVLRFASCLSGYGNHEYSIKNGTISISPNICQYSIGNITKTFPLYLIKEVTRGYSSVILSVSNFEQNDMKIKIRMTSISGAKVLHKDILELVTLFTRSSVANVITDTTHKLWRGAKFITVYSYDVTQTCNQIYPTLYSVKNYEADSTTHSIQSRIVENAKNSREDVKLYRARSIPQMVKKKLSLSGFKFKKHADVSDSTSSQSLLSSGDSADEVLKVAERMLRCKLCDARDCKVLFLPCCHFISCEGCSDNRKSCLECNSFITERVKVFIS